jgi:hypothetical protein
LATKMHYVTTAWMKQQRDTGGHHMLITAPKMTQPQEAHTATNEVYAIQAAASQSSKAIAKQVPFRHSAKHPCKCADGKETAPVTTSWRLMLSRVF